MDFYTLFGVGRGASSGDIERAYRRLIRRYHPGVNPGDRIAEEMYRQVQDAYEVLADSERRRTYDRGELPRPPASETAVEFEGFDFSSEPDGTLSATFSELFSDVFHDAALEAVAPSRGADIETVVNLSFVEAARGADVPVSLTRQERCGACSGQGHVPRAVATCAACRGRGVRRWARGHMVFTKVCEACGGDGNRAVDRCTSCRGAGVITRGEVVTLTVPAAVESGTRLVVPGRGHAGARGGPAGDLYVSLEVGSHPFFTRTGRDLHLRLPVSIVEAALGATVDVPSLDGTVRVTLPPGMPTGTSLRIAGHGAGSPHSDVGDLVVETQIVLPEELDARSRELLAEFGRRNEQNVRRQLFESA